MTTTAVMNDTKTDTKQNPPPGSTPSAPTRSESLTPPRGTLLIVDDETGPRESLRIVFKDQYNVVTANCGRDGVRQAQAHRVDVAILDIRMPDMCGTDVLRELKLIDPRIEVIMLTGYETIETARSAVRYGAADYLNKPFDVFKMRETVARCFEKRRLSIEAEHSIQELQNLNKELEAEVWEKERKLSAGELSAGVVHEMNNPLAIISARAEMLNREIQKWERGDTHAQMDKVKSQIDFIQKEVMRCKRISQRFLNFFRASDADEIVNIDQVVEDAVELIRAHPLCRMTEIRYNPLPNSYLVRAHSADMIQVFINLGINAIQAMNGEGSLTISVETRPTSAEWLSAKAPEGCVENEYRSSQINPGAPAVLVSVKDSGPGIPQAVIKKIFEPYFTTKEKGHGTGLGLAICTRFVDKAQGALRFVSKTGEGTTATVLVPRAEECA